MNIIEEIKKFVEEECKKPASKYGYEPFICHFEPTARYAEQLAEKLNADKEIVVIAAWLHDMGAIIYGREDHHITGAKIAEQKLEELEYPQERIEAVKRCILNHRGSQQNNRQTLDEQIVAEADTMSNFDNLSGIFKAAFIYENQTQIEAKESVKEKLENKFKQLHFEESKKIIEPKYKAVMLLLK